MEANNNAEIPSTSLKARSTYDCRGALMHNFRDAKVMAPRDAVKAKAIETTHGEAPELIAKAFGYEN